ncbi:2-hydroxyacid dehydrogenase [Paracoccus seriniphilus]|uniref:Glyoxylate/hydroxypyruvate reductase A n=1 Tax=Paracoccus seriniphilus TaxID=184748 RepID=A0A239PR51_9RHOB|nr:glyoxylate/hydroxypyruvate reductase A [Paracoccus seriniphilus]WCR13036.1 glyoxylate/hydroxypyruvate reductase A [Paracoccus seriniphilus]SNT72523.1 glyoxylate/hydroxypyruvate reductase A [Paracoccus seriniphilus]
MALLLNVTDPERIEAFEKAFRDFPVRLVRSDEGYDARDIHYIFTWQPVDDWARFPNLRVVFSVSAGVDQFSTLPGHVDLIKMVDGNNTQYVVDYVLAACLACLRRFPVYATRQGQRLWQPDPPRSLANSEIAILGLGEIGQATARALCALGCRVSGWSRSGRDIPGIACAGGEAGYLSLLPTADIVVCLLPLTPQTHGLLSGAFFDRMKPGAALVHAGRGAQCVFRDLGDALRTGQLGVAVIDVFDREPLPEDSEIWGFPNCLITPHVAGRTDAGTAAANVAQNLTRLRQGRDLLWRVDRQKGY